MIGNHVIELHVKKVQSKTNQHGEKNMTGTNDKKEITFGLKLYR